MNITNNKMINEENNPIEVTMLKWAFFVKGNKGFDGPCITY